MAANPSFDIPQQLVLVQGRSLPWAFNLYDVARAPLVVDALDNVRAKLWTTDGASPAIDAESLTPADSYVEIVTNGVVNTTPAKVRIHWHQSDTAGLTAGAVYKFELLLIDQSDGSKAKTICMGTVLIRGAATGDVS